MLNKLQQGTTLVVDRYSFSGAVFTAAKKVPGLNLEWCKVAFYFKSSLPICQPCFLDSHAQKVWADTFSVGFQQCLALLDS